MKFPSWEMEKKAFYKMLYRLWRSTVLSPSMCINGWRVVTCIHFTLELLVYYFCRKKKSPFPSSILIFFPFYFFHSILVLTFSKMDVYSDTFIYLSTYNTRHPSENISAPSEEEEMLSDRNITMQNVRGRVVVIIAVCCCR